MSISSEQLESTLAICSNTMQIVHEQKMLGKMSIIELLKQKKKYKNKIGYTLVNDATDNFMKKEFVALSFRNAIIHESCFDKLYKAAIRENMDVVYCDSTIDKKKHLKTDFSIDIVLQGIEEFDVLLINSELYFMIREIIGDENLNGSCDYLLASYLMTDKIYHLKECLYSTNIPVCLSPKLSEFYLNKNSNITVAKGKVSIIIPTKDKVELLNDCIQSIVEKTRYKNYEILIINNRSEEQESLDYFNRIQNEQIKIVNADIDFNWSKLNNIGIKHSNADVFVLLNNDTKIINEKWLDIIVKDCSRNDIGVVGGLLLYEDNTIQHAGVVVGLVDFADHLYKGEKSDIRNECFYSPTVKRNVLAVTGACMAISKMTIDKIGLFNEDFVICGSDVEICIRAYQKGLFNLYDPDILLYHLESKSRDSYIPPIDFEMSKKYYEPYRSQGDPFFHQKLDKKRTTPTLKGNY